MPTFPVRSHRCEFILLAAILWLYCTTLLNAQEAHAPASNAELERRVRELEETIRQLKAERRKEAPAVKAVSHSAPGTAPTEASPGSDGPTGSADPKKASDGLVPDLAPE